MALCRDIRVGNAGTHGHEHARTRRGDITGVSEEPTHPNQSLHDVYAQLSPEHLAAIAQHFLSGLGESDHPEAQELSQLDHQTATAADVARMHEHAAKHNHGVLHFVLKHPVVTAILGGIAIYEIEKHLKK
jgi:hypothetical protein